MKKIISISFITVLIFFTSCDDFLNRQPLDSLSSETFLQTEAEMELGLNGVYAAAFWAYPNNMPLWWAIETTTDLAIKRVGNAEDLIAAGDGGPFLINNDLTLKAWNEAYRLVTNANMLLDGMQKGKAGASASGYSRIRAEALVLRAWAYYHLMGWFGDPVYFTKPLNPSEYETLPRTPVATVVTDLLKDLDEAVTLFDAANAAPVIKYGRVNKGVALGLKAKIALMVKNYQVAAAACKAIMDAKQYGLNPKFTDLFLLAGQKTNTNREIMFVQAYPTDVLDPQNWLTVITIPRQVNTSQSSHFPSQALVDMYEGKDGLRIDASKVYDPAAPSKNRDNRLKWTIYMQGDTMLHNTSKTPNLPYVQPKERTIYNIYSNIRYKFNWNTNQFDNVTGNIDWIGYLTSPWFAGATGSSGGVGYVWRKYVDPDQYSWEAKTGYILMRYAEILLTYAEAKIELNEIDASVVDAINLVRARAGQPAVTAGTQAQMRQLIRRERAVELAAEGLRLFDLRRWDIYAKAMTGPVVGVSLDPAKPAAIPVIDNDNVPDYTASVSQRLKTRNQTRVNTNAKYKLWPIPQGELDKNKNITQNPGW
jgi:starch-binding outer membrane protein, SusD/RagB family